MSFVAPAVPTTTRALSLDPDETVVNRLVRPMLMASAAYVAAGGYIHLREWLEVYWSVPASAPGSAVVRLGFPLNAGASVLVAVGLVLAATKLPRLTTPLVLSAIAFQVGSLAVLIGTRVSSVFGWAEPVWTTGANQTRAVEIGALVTLAAAVAIRRLGQSRGLVGTPRLVRVGY